MQESVQRRRKRGVSFCRGGRRDKMNSTQRRNHKRQGKGSSTAGKGIKKKISSQRRQARGEKKKKLCPHGRKEMAVCSGPEGGGKVLGSRNLIGRCTLFLEGRWPGKGTFFLISSRERRWGVTAEQERSSEKRKICHPAEGSGWERGEKSALPVLFGRRVESRSVEFCDKKEGKGRTSEASSS